MCLECTLSCSNRKFEGDCFIFPLALATRFPSVTCILVSVSKHLCKVLFCARLSVLQHILSDDQKAQLSTESEESIRFPTTDGSRMVHAGEFG